MSTKIAIPQGSDELAEMLADDKVRAQVFADPGTTQEFLAAYLEAANKGIGKELDAKITAGVVDFLKAQGVKRPDMTEVKAIRPKPGTGAQKAAMHNRLAPGAGLDGTFDDIGDFVNTIHHRQERPNVAKKGKAVEIRDAYASKDPASAGFLIPEDFRSDIMQVALEKSIVRPRATVITMGSLTTTLPYVDTTTNSGSVFGGMIFYWTPEAGAILTSQAKFGRVKLEARKLTGGAGLPNELLFDGPALSSWLDKAAPEGIAFFEDLAFIDGDGANEPLGFLNCAAAISITKETGQADDTVVPENIFKMFSRMLPQSMGSAVWLINQTVLPQILGLTLPVGTGGAPISLVDVHASPVMTLLGRPMIITEKVPSLGNAGDVSFVDFGYYLIGDRQAVSVETSEHAEFMSDMTMLKIIERVDGRPWIQSAITPVNGDTVSPVVTLGAR